MTLRPQALELLAAAALAAALPLAHAAERGETAGPGLGYALPLGAQWQARLGTSAATRPLHAEAEPAARSLSLLGDYYIPQAFGLRATGGIVLGKGEGRAGPTLWPALGQRAGLSYGGLVSWSLDDRAAYEVAPYFGLGYTGLAVQGSLGFFADVGLRGLQPRSGVRLGGAPASLHRDGEPEIWRPWREWRLEPVLQLGVSYAF
ncbi:hypothetical protein [Caldimonas tepidiphila]|uniref:hypothetical protein n=1 Tax=Caldimonas tepidiphila TaxID=2315841 RepID=UPI000E5B6005|nr:hypothetical protein [Caldimonas tepidiphila]